MAFHICTRESSLSSAQRADYLRLLRRLLLQHSMESITIRGDVEDILFRTKVRCKGRLEGLVGPGGFSDRKYARQFYCGGMACNRLIVQLSLSEIRSDPIRYRTNGSWSTQLSGRQCACRRRLCRRHWRELGELIWYMFRAGTDQNLCKVGIITMSRLERR